MGPVRSHKAFYFIISFHFIQFNFIYFCFGLILCLFAVSFFAVYLFISLDSMGMTQKEYWLVTYAIISSVALAVSSVPEDGHDVLSSL